MDSTTPSKLDVEVAGGVAVVTINRPSNANTLDGPLHDALTHIWVELERDSSVAAVVLTGSGSTFCGGGDRDRWDALANDRRYRRRRLADARALILNMLRCELPIIAAVNGPAVGVGCSIVAACDIVMMAPDAYLVDPHVSAGIVAGDGGAALLPEVLPLSLARKMLYTGARLDADAAHAVHFAAEIVPAQQLLPAAVHLGRRLSKMPWEALRDTKRTANMALLQRVGPALEFGSAVEGASFDTPEFGGGRNGG